MAAIQPGGAAEASLLSGLTLQAGLALAIQRKQFTECATSHTVENLCALFDTVVIKPHAATTSVMWRMCTSALELLPPTTPGGHCSPEGATLHASLKRVLPVAQLIEWPASGAAFSNESFLSYLAELCVAWKSWRPGTMSTASAHPSLWRRAMVAGPPAIVSPSSCRSWPRSRPSLA